MQDRGLDSGGVREDGCGRGGLLPPWRGHLFYEWLREGEGPVIARPSSLVPPHGPAPKQSSPSHGPNPRRPSAFGPSFLDRAAAKHAAWIASARGMRILPTSGPRKDGAAVVALLPCEKEMATPCLSPYLCEPRTFQHLVEAIQGLFAGDLIRLMAPPALQLISEKLASFTASEQLII